MFDIVVFDDDKMQCDMIKELVEKNSSREVLVTAVSVKEELLALAENGRKIDILVSDIHLEGEAVNGIDIVKQIQRQNHAMQVIYITGYVEYCVDVYETEHVYFLKKPVEEAKLKTALDKAFSNIIELQKQVLTIQNAGSVRRIPINEILYMESEKRKLRIVCNGQSYETYDKISNMMEKVGSGFVQCHKSCIVNMRYIKELKSDRILLDNGMEVMVSRNRYRETKEIFLDYISHF